MEYMSMFILVLLILNKKINALVCTCNCGASTYYPSASCTTATRCTEICYWGYSTCYQVNTQGCCGTAGCTWYAGDTMYNDPGTCVCKCGSSEVGRANSTTCSTSTCKSACQILYPSSCTTSTNQAYCSNANIHYQTGTSFFVFLFTVVIYFTRK